MRFRLSQTAVVAALVVVFLVANRGAYEGYFSDDDLENLLNNTFANFNIFWRGFGSFTYDTYNFRPVGHLTYRWMGQAWGLSFTPYVVLIQLLHFLNACLVYSVTQPVLLGRAAFVAAVFFAFHPALLAAHWKPMYLFDVLCGSALLSTYYCYRRDWWPVSLLLFWCAYKSKEVAIFFPLVLVAEEWWGQRRWMRVLPFLAISASFGGQAVVANRQREAGSYSLQFTFAAMWECLRFYARAAFGVPWILIAGWAWLPGNERRWLAGGVLAITMLVGPLLFLPGRLFSVYLYVPLMFGAIAVGAVSTRLSPLLLLALMVTYFGFGLSELRAFRRAELTQAQATGEFVGSACLVLKDQQHLSQASYEGHPAGLNTWGVVAALRLCSGNLHMSLRPWDLKSLNRGEPVIRWTKMPGKEGLVELTRFQGELTGDWYAWDGSFRWMGAKGSMQVKARAGDRRLVFDLVAAPADELEVRFNGEALGVRQLENRGPQQVTFEVQPRRTAETVIVELSARPTQRVLGDPRELGIAVRSVRSTP